MDTVMNWRQKVCPKNQSYIFKICLIGDGGVGKTCISRKLCFNTFSLNTKLTVGIDFYTYQFQIKAKSDEDIVELSIWDFGGQEQFKTLFRSYIHGVNGIFLVFDLLRMESLMKLNWWYDKLVEYKMDQIPKILVGSKLDLARLEDKQLKVDRLVVEQFLKRHNESDYIQTSAKDNTNISLIFKMLTKKIFDFNNFFYENIY